ncbi:hypothetical protein JAAARDRAFT_124834 [Jaapia argillacea MUCL 33604]|uniref:FAS1 domain-containing protein n=1 Tax=Jaapia argillacea MUCL 33604 TaxID=933084 RepID=A0A067Q325_9AGAM|nr:hypothetical protein JAAARDRAFT_124834 [Jaapia argillacea MUCL 33604]
MLFSTVSATLCGALAVSAIPAHRVDGLEPEHPPSLFWQSVQEQWTVETKPHFPHPPTRHTDQTIYEVLNEHPQFAPPFLSCDSISPVITRFSRLVKAINFTGVLVDLLNDSSTAGLTFFAPPNSALPRKPRRGHHDLTDLGDDEMPHPFLSYNEDFLDAISAVDDLDDSDDFGEDKKRKERFRKILTAVLLYHVIPEQLNKVNLAKNNTWATNLTLSDGSLDGEPYRLKVAAGPLGGYVNWYAKLIKEVPASNGFIHVINHPLIPPPSIFQVLFNLPHYFSIATSALQRVAVSGATEWRHLHSDSYEVAEMEGNPAVTAFIPSNKAFDRLPLKLKLFLFSPFGERVLKKVLEYHIIPDFILHTDYYHNATSDSDDVFYDDFDEESYVDPCWEEASDEEWDIEDLDLPRPPRPPKTPQPPRPPRMPNHPRPPHLPRGPHHVPHPPPLYSVNVTLPTLLPEHHLHIHIAKFGFPVPVPGPHKPKAFVTKFYVNGQPVPFYDGVARNGAVHIIDRVLNPVKHHGKHDKPPRKDYDEFVDDDDVDEGWEDWEEWLPQWAGMD